MTRRNCETCAVNQHHAAAEIRRLKVENQRLQDRLFAVDHEEIQRAEARKLARPVMGLAEYVSQPGAYAALLRSVGANVGLHGSVSEIQEQAARAVRSTLGQVGVRVDHQATFTLGG